MIAKLQLNPYLFHHPTRSKNIKARRQHHIDKRQNLPVSVRCNIDIITSSRAFIWTPKSAISVSYVICMSIYLHLISRRTRLSDFPFIICFHSNGSELSRMSPSNSGKRFLGHLQMLLLWHWFFHPLQEPSLIETTPCDPLD